MDYFDTVITITGYEKSQEEFDKVANEILNQLGEYHKLYTIYHRFDGVENLCTINELADGKHRTVTVDRKIIDMLLFAKEMSEKTNGTTNVAMGSVLSIWHNYRNVGKDNPDAASLPPMYLLEKAARHTNIDNMVIDEVNNTVTLTDSEMTLDVGAVAKGYAAERVARYLEEKGISGYVINVGGNVCTIGTKADGSKWTVGIENPNGNDYLAYLELDGQSVVTSGSYQRFYYVDGKPYHHIIDPDTLMPAQGYLSVSIVCDDSGLGDALSTALFCMTKEEGLKLIESLSGVEAMWVTETNEKFFSSGWSKYEKRE
jgi:thiamine biosynthesis lipoprotein